jgi:hypothetical protein
MFKYTFPYIFIFLFFKQITARFVRGSELLNRSVTTTRLPDKLSSAVSKQHIKVNPLPHNIKYSKKLASGNSFVNNWEMQAKEKGLVGITMDGYRLYNTFDHSGELKQMILMLTEAGVSGVGMKKLVIEYCNKNALKSESSLSMEIFEKFVAGKVEKSIETRERSSEAMKEELKKDIYDESYESQYEQEKEYDNSVDYEPYVD